MKSLVHAPMRFLGEQRRGENQEEINFYTGSAPVSPLWGSIHLKSWSCSSFFFFIYGVAPPFDTKT
jgi:hypothetical protein